MKNQGADNKHYYPTVGASIGACRAFFEIGDDDAQAPAFNISFGDGPRRHRNR